MKPLKEALSVLVRDTLFLGVAAFAVVVTVGLAWYLFDLGAPAKPATAQRFTHMHCPKCGEEISYNPQGAGRVCATCAGANYVPTIGTLEDIANEPSQSGAITFFVLVILVLVQGLAFFGAMRSKYLRDRAFDVRNRKVLARCPFCKRKVSFPVSKAGTWTTCYQCKTAYQLVSIDTLESVSPK